MTSERMAALVARWVRFYTRKLPPAVAERRIGEIDADLHDHVAHERERGVPESRIALGIAARMVRGLAADASWRRQELGRRSALYRPVRITACILLVLLVWMALSDGMNWGVFDFVFAAILLCGAGVLVELALRRPGNLVVRVITAAVGVAAVVLGELDDAPGLVGFGCLLIGGTVALTVRTALRSE